MAPKNKKGNNKVVAPPGGKTGGSGGTPKQVQKEVNKAVNNAGLSAKEAKFISDLIGKAAQTGKGISEKEKQVILNEAKRQASDKNKGVSPNKTQDLRGFLVEGKSNLPTPSSQGGGGGGGSFTQNFGSGLVQQQPPAPVKIPGRDVVDFNEPPIDAATIQNLFFENIGAVELTKFVRHDTVEGINPFYNIISNLSGIKRQYDASNLISVQKTGDSLFDIFNIDLSSKIPDDNYLISNNLFIVLPNGLIFTYFIYVDVNGDIVLEIVNMNDDEIVEFQIDTSGTIYEVN
jgi:hypothetical protein